MSLTDEQKQAISKTLEEGASIADVQKLLDEEYGVAMTYMDVRFLIDDLNLEIKDKAPQASASGGLDQKLPKQGAQDAEEPLLVDEGGGGQVSVEIDRVKRPGAALSGAATFSDGKRAQWYVDPYGRLGLEPEQEGYQPSEADLQAFQEELQKQIQGPSGMGL